MVDHKKIYRVFQLISRLRSPFGVSKAVLARDFDVTERTIERYLILLNDLGFNVVKKAKKLQIENIDKYQPTSDDLIVFSIEEAAIIRDAVLNSKLQGPLQKSVLSKLYALTDIDEVAETIYRQSITKNISTIRKAIKSKEQIVLKNYHSVSSGNTSDRLIEPIKFFSYYTYLIAFEVDTQMIKQFKIDRIGGVVPTGYHWQFESLHGSYKIDAFGMSGTDPIPVNLELTTRAHRLMEEEFPDTSLRITTTSEGANYQGQVYSFEGIGRFIMGLLDEIEVIEPKELKKYVEGKVKGWRNAK